MYNSFTFIIIFGFTNSRNIIIYKKKLLVHREFVCCLAQETISVLVGFCGCGCCGLDGVKVLLVLLCSFASVNDCVCVCVGVCTCILVNSTTVCMGVFMYQCFVAPTTVRFLK